MSNLENFRAEVSEWLEENCPPSMRTPMVEMKLSGVAGTLSTKILNQKYG